jgi:hypothetical protein
LGDLFGLTPGDVRKALRDSDQGLTQAELHQREERVSIVTESKRYALRMATRTGIRSFVHLENEMHRSGVIDSLSSASGLAALFGVTSGEIRKALQLLPGDDRHYRNSVLGNEDFARVKNSIVAEVGKEISGVRIGSLKEFRSDEELAKRYGVRPVTVSRTLRDELSEPEWTHREYMLSRQGILGQHQNSVVAYARAELEAFDKGELASLSSEEQLAKMFNISSDLVKQRFREPNSGLSLVERKYRRYVFRNQFPDGPAASALRNVNVMYLKEAIERRSLEKSGRKDQSSEQSGIEAIQSRPSRSVVYNGHRHDSYEEAVCGVLLEKYIPGFKLREGDTFQVPLAGGKRADFRVGTTIVEWHPVLMFKTKEGVGSFADFNELKEYQAIKSKLTDSKARLFEAETKRKLADRYYQARKEDIDSTPNQRGRELVVADTAKAFYHAVVARFGRDIPSEQKFLREFNKVKTRVKRAVLNSAN